MSSILEKKIKIAKLNKKKKRKTISLIKKTRLIGAVSQKTVKKIAIYYVSIRTLFTFHGNEIRGRWRSKKITLKIRHESK